jgi:hypothetical protein
MPVTCIYNLAAELGVNSRQIIAWLTKDKHIHGFRTAASPVPDHIAELIRRDFRRTKPRRPFSAPTEQMNDAATMFGVSVESLRPARDSRPRRRYQSSESRRPLDDWTNNLISVEDKRQWINAGLGPNDARIAMQCLQAGISPDDLMLRVDGVRAAERLRGGESVASVRIRVQETKRRQADAG